jgi:hypothetical protein
MIKDDDDIQDYVRPWVGLTDEEIKTIWYKTSPYYNENDFAKAIEQALKEKNI